MNKRTNLTIYCLLAGIVLCTSCTKNATTIVCPFTVQTHMKNGANGIHNVFALPNNTFVVMTHDRANDFSTLYLYNGETHFIDSLVISGDEYSKPIIEPDNSFIMIGENVDSTAGISVVKIDFSLRKLKSRNIESLYAPTMGELRYYNKLTKLANGNYVVGTTHEKFPDPLQDKVVLFCVKDIFADNQVLWRINPVDYTDQWMEEIQGDEYGNFYVASGDHLHSTTNWITKYDGSGNLIYENTYPHTHSNYNIFLEKDKLIYHDWWNYYVIDLQGKLLAKNPFGVLGKASSDIVKVGDNYFYTTDTVNSDGKFLELRKTDAQFRTIKSKMIGNRGTHTIDSKRYFILLSSGDMVAIALVENPDLTGNMWLLHRFNSELESDK